MTCEQALNHPWITNREQMPSGTRILIFFSEMAIGGGAGVRIRRLHQLKGSIIPLFIGLSTSQVVVGNHFLMFTPILGEMIQFDELMF